MVRLLRGSGTSPTLVVQSMGSARSSTSNAPMASIKRNSQAFRDKVSRSSDSVAVIIVHLQMEQVLGTDERQAVIEKLGRFSRDK